MCSYLLGSYKSARYSVQQEKCYINMRSFVNLWVRVSSYCCLFSSSPPPVLLASASLDNASFSLSFRKLT